MTTCSHTHVPSLQLEYMNTLHELFQLLGQSMLVVQALRKGNEHALMVHFL